MIFDRDAKAIQWRKEIFQQMMLEKWDSMGNKNNSKINLDLSLNIIQKLTKNDHRLKCKTVTLLEKASENIFRVKQRVLIFDTKSMI